METRRKLAYNTIFSTLYQIVLLVCGFIVPKVFLLIYGSEINGLVNSIQHFLGIISFLELGVGAVAQAALYKPLADGASESISKIYVSGQRVYSKIGIAMAVYTIVLAVGYPIVEKSFAFSFESSLIIVLSVNLLAQYFFGIINRILLMADQRGYVVYIVHLCR